MSESNRIDLPSGGWAVLKDPEDITEGERRPLMQPFIRVTAVVEQLSEEKRAALEQGNVIVLDELAGDGFLEESSHTNDLAVATFVESWSYEAPVSVEAVLKLKRRDYDRLRLVCAELTKELFLDTEPSDQPDSPTAPSEGSATTSEGGKPTGSRRSGAPTASSSSASA